MAKVDQSVVVRIPREVHLALKVRAAESGKDMSEMAGGFIKDGLGRARKAAKAKK